LESDNREILISDSCIFFDLIELDLIHEFFKLGYAIYTTNMVIGEIADDAQLSIVSNYIADGKLTVDSHDSLMAVQEILEKHPGLSFTDCSVLELANRLKCGIISSDKGLRNESKRRNITARGILWIIENLSKKKIITVEKALEKLKIYPEINKRAPLNEITNLVENLRNQLD
jgi:hypothetical protein